jgi:hypothetical protein
MFHADKDPKTVLDKPHLFGVDLKSVQLLVAPQRRRPG